MSAVLTPTTTASPWRPALLALSLVLLCLGVLYRDTVETMVGIWYRSETFAHAFLVPPISVWLIWRQREALARLTPRAQPWVLVAIAVCSAVWLLSDLVLVNAGAQFAWVAMVVLSVPAVLGFQVTLVILFPLLFLFFGVPFGEFMLPPMMDWTADFVVAALQLTGIPVYREGMNFVIPSGNWSVIDECSGVRYLIASFMVGTLFAYLNYRSYKRRAVFMAVSIAVPIVANWLRAYIIVMLGHLSGNKIAVGVDHILYGWVFFGIVIFVMFMIGSRWSEPDAPAPTGLRVGDTAPAVDSRQMFAAVAAALLVIALPHAALWGLHRIESTASAPQLTLPATPSPGLTLEPRPALAWSPVWENPAVKVDGAYVGASAPVGVFIAYYRGQDADSKLVTGLNGVVGMNDRKWNPVGRSTVTVVVAGRSVAFQTTDIQAPQRAEGTGRGHLVAWRVYWIDGRFVAGDAEAKLRNAVGRLRGRGDDGAALVLYADRDSFDDAHEAVRAFAQANLAPLAELLQATRDRR